MEQLSRWVNTLLEYLLSGMGLAMALIVALQVFFRYVLNQSIFWSEEVARFLLVWLTFLGATVAYYRGANPGVDALYLRLSPSLQWFCRLATGLLALFFFGIMIIYGCQFAYFVRLQISPALQLPKWLPHSVIPLAGLVMFLHTLTFLLRLFQIKRSNKP